MVFLGIDIGTSAVKAVLVDERETVVGEGSAPIPSSEPRPGWSEQNPEDWWRATEASVAAVRAAAPQVFGAVAAIGLSGQMHGVTLLDAADQPIRPSIIWNDGRGVEECAEIDLQWSIRIIIRHDLLGRGRWFGKGIDFECRRARKDDDRLVLLLPGRSIVFFLDESGLQSAVLSVDVPAQDHPRRGEDET